MQKTIVELVCDMCGSTEDVKERGPLKVNRREVVLDACGSCWPAEKLRELIQAGRRPGASRRLVRA